MINSSNELGQGFTKEYLQKWSIVKDIKYGMIMTKDGRYLTILEVTPINFHLRTFEEQQDIINQFYSWLKVAPAKIQFLVSSDTINTSELIKNIRNNTSEETNEDFLKMQDDYIQNSIKALSSHHTMTKKYLIVLQYLCNVDGTVSQDELEIATTLMDLRNTTQNSFKKIGCFVVDHEDENYFLGQCIYEQLNPFTSKEETLSERIERVHRDHCITQKNLQPKENINDYLVARTGIDDRNPRFIYNDGIYQEVVYIKGRTLPICVPAGWLDYLTNCGKGYEISITVRKENKEMVKEKTSRSMRLNRSAIKNSSDIEKINDTQSNISNNSYIYQALKNEEDIYDVCILIKMTANTYEQLQDMKNHLTTVLKKNEIKIGNCYTRELDAMKMTLPLLHISRPIFEKCKRNFLSSSLASMFPFTSFELFSSKGVVMGINTLNNSLTVPDIFDTKRFANANMSIFGESGSGKTYLEQILGYGLRLSGYKVFYIVPIKGHEYRRGCKAINGSYNKFTPGGIQFNPLGIIPENNEDESLLEGVDYVKASYLSKKMTEFKSFTQLLLRNTPMTFEEETRFDIALSRLYKQFGITDDNDSIYENKETGKLKVMPIIEDFYNLLITDKTMKRVATAYEIFVKGIWKNFNTQTNIDLSNNYNVFDVDSQDIPKNLHSPFMLLAILIAYSYIKSSRTEKCVLFLDEVWKAMLTEESAELVFEIVKIIRGYGGSVVLGTQDLNDYFGLMDGKYAKGIMNNTKIKIILHTEEDIDILSERLRLSKDEKKMVMEFGKGKGLLIANKDRIPIAFKATDLQDEYFTTDVNRLKEIAMKRKMQQREVK